MSINMNDLQKQIDQHNGEKEELIFLYNQLMLNLDLKDSLSTELLEPLKELNKKNDLDNRSNYSQQILASAIKIIDAKQKVDKAQRVALKRWEEQNPAETAALRKLSTAIAEAEARQSNISTNWMGSTPTSSDLKVKRTN
jgi:hypothetical protein